MGGVVRNFVLALVLFVIIVKNRSTPTVKLTGEASYKKLLDVSYPVGSCYISHDEDFDPNTAWGGTWERLPEEIAGNIWKRIN